MLALRAPWVDTLISTYICDVNTGSQQRPDGPQTTRARCLRARSLCCWLFWRRRSSSNSPIATKENRLPLRPFEVLLKRGFIVRTGKNPEATEKSIHLIEVVHPEVKSPAMTGQWEAFLKKIQQGQSRLEPFLDGISQYVRSVVGKVGQTRPVSRTTVYDSPKITESPDPASAKTFSTFTTLTELLEKAFGFPTFRPNQEAVCKEVTAGKDALLVMPTGSGKSPCYQLPGSGARWNHACDQSPHRLDGPPGT